uniref:Calponin homology domain-containing protein DDB_G0272472-like isoform X41 n=1 Tax=Crassostrea virginica TaxID=6565 RepID=A0A8B8B9D4_CRAVI|nr:calponin homology domain-containing protein DDB_G0272472-like isoform X41 [Crassostrea virginica]
MGTVFFEAVSDQLKRLHLPYQNHIQLRHSVVEFCKKNATLKRSDGDVNLQDFVDGGDLSEYLERMSKQGEWADHVIVMCMALFLQRDILVITSSPSAHPDNNLLWIHGGRGQSNPLLLGHVWENHYQSLRPCLSLSSEFAPQDSHIPQDPPLAQPQVLQAQQSLHNPPPSHTPDLLQNPQPVQDLLQRQELPQKPTEDLNSSMAYKEGSVLTVFTVNMGNRRVRSKTKKGKKENKHGWTEFRKGYLNNILMKEKPDIVFVQEGVRNLLIDTQKENYDIFPKSEQKKYQSLVQIIIKKNITYKEIKDIPNSIRDRVKAVTITYEGLPILCASVHGRNLKRRKNSSIKMAKERNEKAFLEFLGYLDRQRKTHFRPIVIGGDFNIDVDRFKKVAKKIVNSSLSVIQAKASDQEDKDKEASFRSDVQATSIDYDFFLTSKEMLSNCKKRGQNNFFPKNTKLASKNIIDHAPTQIRISLKRLQGIEDEKNVSRRTFNALIKKRKDQYKKLCEALESCKEEEFDVVDPNFDKLLKKAETNDEKSNLDENKRIVKTFDEKKALKQAIKYLTEMQFVVKASTTGHNHEEHGDIGASGNKLAGKKDSHKADESLGECKKRKSSASGDTAVADGKSIASKLTEQNPGNEKQEKKKSQGPQKEKPKPELTDQNPGNEKKEKKKSQGPQKEKPKPEKKKQGPQKEKPKPEMTDQNPDNEKKEKKKSQGPQKEKPKPEMTDQNPDNEKKEKKKSQGPQKEKPKPEMTDQNPDNEKKEKKKSQGPQKEKPKPEVTDQNPDNEKKEKKKSQGPQKEKPKPEMTDQNPDNEKKEKKKSQGPQKEKPKPEMTDQNPDNEKKEKKKSQGPQKEKPKPEMTDQNPDNEKKEKEKSQGPQKEKPNPEVTDQNPDNEKKEKEKSQGPQKEKPKPEVTDQNPDNEKKEKKKSQGPQKEKPKPEMTDQNPDNEKKEKKKSQGPQKEKPKPEMTDQNPDNEKKEKKKSQGPQKEKPKPEVTDQNPDNEKKEKKKSQGPQKEKPKPEMTDQNPDNEKKEKEKSQGPQKEKPKPEMTDQNPDNEKKEKLTDQNPDNEKKEKKKSQGPQKEKPKPEMTDQNPDNEKKEKKKSQGPQKEKPKPEVTDQNPDNEKKEKEKSQGPQKEKPKPEVTDQNPDNEKKEKKKSQGPQKEKPKPPKVTDQNPDNAKKEKKKSQGPQKEKPKPEI